MKYETINEVILALILWISTNTDYPKTENNIKVEFIEQKVLERKVCTKSCEILAYTPHDESRKVYLVKSLDPRENVCHQGILLHEIIHVIQEEVKFATEFDLKTKKHLREMDALVNQNIFLSQFGKKILYSNGFAGKFKTDPMSKNNIYC